MGSTVDRINEQMINKNDRHKELYNLPLEVRVNWAGMEDEHKYYRKQQNGLGKTCQRCGLGVAGDATGAWCKICVNWSDVKLRDFQEATEHLCSRCKIGTRVKFVCDFCRDMSDAHLRRVWRNRGMADLGDRADGQVPTEGTKVGKVVGTFEEAQLMSGAALSVFDEGLLHSYGIVWGRDERV